MKIAGVICEYNPFHRGHAYHLAETRARTDCDYIVACMTGSFVQRGEAACLSKWTRAEMALRSGADAVFELPALYAIRTADVFARGGVAILSGIGADVLSFGSETADMHLLESIAELRENEPECVSNAIRRGLSEGKSHARAQGEAIAEYLNLNPELLDSPNLILACEYLRAIHALSARIQPIAIRRAGDYHSGETGAGYASATAVRRLLRMGEMKRAAAELPETVQFALREWKGMHAPDDLLLHCLRSMTESEITALPDVSEGLENRVKRAASEAFDRESLIEKLKCKRYTRARLNRLCAHAMLGLTRALAERHPTPEYARLIGMREDARPLLRELKRRAQIPIVSSPKALVNSEVFALEARATDLRALCMNAPEQRTQNTEWTAKFVRV